MKKALAVFTLIFFSMIPLFAEEEINPVTGFPEIKNQPFAMFNEGVIFNQINRIEFKKESSNFVRQDYLVGAYASLQTKHIQPADSYLQISAFYPVHQTFNGMKQVPKQMFLFAFDVFYGPYFETDMWKYVRIHFIPGLHYTYQITDEFHLHYVGLQVKSGIDLPLAHHWSILLSGAFTLDYANLGTNRLIQPYDMAWQYRISLGVRYSRKGRNDFAYIESRRSVKKN